MLSDTKLFPAYIRLTKQDSDFFPGLGRYLKYLKYPVLNLFAEDDPFTKDLAARGLDTFSRVGVTCITPDELKPVTAQTIADPSNHHEIGDFVKNSNIRPILSLTLSNGRKGMLDALHEVGLRAEDVIILFPGFFNDVVIDSDPEVVKYRTEFIDNSMTFDFAAFVGALGEQAKEIIANTTQHSALPGHCQYYDGAYFIAYTLKYMITRGEDFEDPDLFNDRMRKTQMYGCSGRIIIESDSNDRSSQDVDIYNTRLIDGEFQQILTYRISLTTSTFITRISAPVWPGNSTEAPPLYILNYKDCPFPEEYRQDYAEGVQVMAYIGVAIGGVALIVGLVAYICTRKESQELLTEKFDATFEDLLQQYSVPFNAVQYLALGPTLMSSVNISELLMFSLIGPYGKLDLENDAYWRLLNVLFAVQSVWLIAFILLVLRHQGLSKVKLLSAAAVYLVPFISLFLFLPMLLFFLELFVCTEAHSAPGTTPSLNDSFMRKDCDQDCWTGDHLAYSVISCMFCCMFVATRAFATGMWQDLTPDIDIVARRSYLHLKSLAEVVLLLSSHIVRRGSETAHAIIYIAVLAGLLLETSLRRPYTYSRLNLGLGVCLSICLCLGALGLTQLYVPSFTGLTGDCIALGLVGVAVCEAYLGIGLIIQIRYLPNLVNSTKVPYEGELFKFAFDLRDVEPHISIRTRGRRGAPLAYVSSDSPSQ